MTSTAGGATWDDAGVLEAGSVPVTYHADLVQGDSWLEYPAWWTLDVAEPSIVVIDSSPSTGTGNIIGLAVFQGPSSEDTGNSWVSTNMQGISSTSEVTGEGVLQFTALPDVTYHVEAATPDHYAGAGIDYQLSVTIDPVPAEAALAGGSSWNTATALSPEEQPGVTYRGNLTVPGEEYPYWCAWWRFTADANRTITLDTFGTVMWGWIQPDTRLRVYSGSTYAGRVLVAENDNQPGSHPYAESALSTLTFNADAGVTYHVMVGGNDLVDGLPDIYHLNIDWGVGPVGLSVTFTGSDVEITGDYGDTGFQLADGGLQMPAKQARIRYASDSEWTHGSVALASSWQQSFLALRVIVEGASETDLATKLADLEEAIGQFSYTVTITRGDQVTAWRADQGSMQVEQPRTFYLDDDFTEVWTVTIPVYPIPS